MKRFSLILILAGVSLVLAPTQLAAGWARTYGGSDYDFGIDVQQTSDGGYITTGGISSVGAGESDLWILKTDNKGNSVWSTFYGGTDWDYGTCIRQTSDGNYIVVGTTSSMGAGAEDVWLLKINTQGDTLWMKTYGGEGFDRGDWIEETDDGGYIILGYTSSFSQGVTDFWLLKTDAYGNTLWTHAYGGDSLDWGHCVQPTSDGGYIMTGRAYPPGEETQYNDLWLVKTDAQGTIEWTSSYGTNLKDCGFCIRQTTDGSYIVTGFTGFSAACTYGNLWLLKIDPQGDTVWTRTYGSFKADLGVRVEQTSDGGYIVAGGTNSLSAGGEDFWLLKTDENGDTLWTRTYGGEDNDVLWGMQQTSDGGYILIGDTYSYGAGNSDLWLIKTDSLGNVAIEEEPPTLEPPFEVTSTIGSHIVLRYENRPQGFHAAVFNASGQKVDEIHSTETSGSVTWGEGHSPGVYFIMPTDGELSKQKVILIR